MNGCRATGSDLSAHRAQPGDVEEELGGTAEAIYLVDLAPAARAHALGRAGAVLSHDTSKELRPDEISLIRKARLLQFTAAGVDWVPTRDLPGIGGGSQ